MIVELIVGDESGDGHNIRESLFIKTDLDPEKLNEAMSSELIRDFINNTNADYEDGKFPIDFFSERDLGERTKKCIESCDLGNGSYDYYEGIRVELINAMINDYFDEDVVEPTEIESYYVGGYGLFY